MFCYYFLIYVTTLLANFLFCVSLKLLAYDCPACFDYHSFVLSLTCPNCTELGNSQSPKVVCDIANLMARIFLMNLFV